jgi:hypothetical protein
MINKINYDKIKTLNQVELKIWLEQNNLSFNDIFRFRLNQSNQPEPVCPCCGEENNKHINECIYKDEQQR